MTNVTREWRAIVGRVVCGVYRYLDIDIDIEIDIAVGALYGTRCYHHSPFPGFERGTIRVVCCKLRVQQGEDILKGCRAPTKAVFRGSAVTAVIVILCTSLTACLLGEE